MERRKHKAKAVVKMNKSGVNVLQSLFFILVIIVSGYVLLKSPVFSIDTISVLGNNNVGAAEIESLSGISKGNNIFQVDLGRAKSAISAYPLVKRVDVHRKLPSSIVINIVERQAVALLLIKGEFWEVDDEQVLLRKTTSERLTSLPVITGTGKVTPSPGIKVPGKEVKAGIQSIMAMDATLRNRVSEVYVDDPYNIIVLTMDGVQIRLGDSNNIPEKFKIVDNVLKRQHQPVEYIDISVAGSPVLRLVGAEQEAEQETEPVAKEGNED